MLTDRPPVQRSAVVSPCGTYRYDLRRQWDDRPPLWFLMLNPSTADGRTDDPTIRKCMGFARCLGHGGIVVRNLYAYRATKPSELVHVLRHQGASAAVGPEGDAWVLDAAEHTRMVIAAWGSVRVRDSVIPGRGAGIAARLTDVGVSVTSLGTTVSGAPRHPVMLGYNAGIAALDDWDAGHIEHPPILITPGRLDAPAGLSRLARLQDAGTLVLGNREQLTAGVFGGTPVDEFDRWDRRWGGQPDVQREWSTPPNVDEVEPRGRHRPASQLPGVQVPPSGGTL